MGQRTIIGGAAIDQSENRRWLDINTDSGARMYSTVIILLAADAVFAVCFFMLIISSRGHRSQNLDMR